MTHFLTEDLDRLGDQVENSVRGGEYIHFALGLIDNENELVTTESCGKIIGTNARANPVGDGNEETITTAVTKIVIHYLEAVEVNHHYRGLTPGIESRF